MRRRRVVSLSRSTPPPASRFRRWGPKGQAAVILDVVRQRAPDAQSAISLGCWFTTAPPIHDGVICKS